MESLLIESKSTTQVCLLWLTKLPECFSETNSAHFTFRNRQYSMCLSLPAPGRYSLFLVLDEESAIARRPTLAFNARVCIARESEEYMSLCTSASYGRFFVWSGSIHDMKYRVPGFDRRGYTSFRIVLESDSGDLRPKPETEVVKVQKIPSSQTCCPLSADLQKLMEKGFDSDLELRCGHLAIPAHRLILSARSEVFRAMLQSDIKDRSFSSIKIEDMEFPVLQHFLRYLYSGTLPEMTVELAKRLYETGEKYLVKNLMELCAEFLTENLSMQNACELLVLADTHNGHKFKVSVIDFIIECEIPKKDPEWSQFCKNHPLLALEVLNKYVSKH